MSRADSSGLWWHDVAKVRGSKSRGPRTRGPMPPIPESKWRPPSEFPNLSQARVLGFDLETYDPELKTAGPGWARGKGHIIGASLAVADGSSWYFPIRHGIEDGKQILPEDEAKHNMDTDKVLGFLDYVLNTNRPKVGANLTYDLGWATQEGVRVAGKLYDVQFAEALLNSETPDVTLEGLAQKYEGIGKESSELYRWLASWLGGKIDGRQRANLYLSPPSLAGPYAEADAALPIRILEDQWPLLEKRGVLDLFDLECRLIPLLVKMRFKGAPVNIEYAAKLYDELGDDMKVTSERMKEVAGQAVNPNARDSLLSAFRKLSLPVPMVPDAKNGGQKISFAAPLLEVIDHPLIEVILEHKRTEKVRNTFVKGYILDKNINSKLYCSFHPLKGEGGGARSGRFASSLPNLQNIPIRTEIGRRIRTAFEATGQRWRKWDFSQIEYRMLAHYATGAGAEELRAAYNLKPDIDYHEFTIELVRDMTGVYLERRPAKNINFGLIYGMSEPKLSKDLGLSKSEGSALFKNYHTAAPYVKETMELAGSEVDQYGYVTTILGRKSDFSKWSKKGWGDESKMALSYDAACQKWGPYNIERAAKHKGLNRKLQGSAADVMKKAMVDAYEAGCFEDDACGMPALTVHDELDFDDENDLDNPAWIEFQHIMENSMAHLMSVPILIDQKMGENWGLAD